MIRLHHEFVATLKWFPIIWCPDNRFLVVVSGKDHKDIAHFVFDKLATIENVRSTTTHFIFKSYKDHGVLMEDHDDSSRLAIMP